MPMTLRNEADNEFVASFCKGEDTELNQKQFNRLPQSEYTMKILLQHNQTLHYLRADKSWARSDAEARTFLHSQRAIEFAHQHNLRDVYVTVKFLGGDPEV